MAHLRREKIRLWLPPYHAPGDGADDALTELAQSLDKRVDATAAAGDANASAADIRAALVDLRSHAVRKWRE